MAIKSTYWGYLGPTIRGVVQHAAVYGGDYAQVCEQLQYAIDKYPRIKNLIVPEATLPTDRFKIRTPGNLLYDQNRKLIAELNGK